MCATKRTLPLWAAVFLLLTALPQVRAAVEIARVSRVDGDRAIVLQAFGQAETLKGPGQALQEGFVIQTDNATVWVTFADGAILRIEPYSCVMVHQQFEKMGLWPLAANRPVRRVTCLVGKIGYQSDGSVIVSYLQSPGSLSRIKGVDADFGYDNQSTFLDLHDGQAEPSGRVLRRAFEAAGPAVAAQSAAWKAVSKACDIAESAGSRSGSMDLTLAVIEGLKARMTLVGLLGQHPDSAVRKMARARKLALRGCHLAVEGRMRAGVLVETIERREAEQSRAARQPAPELEAARTAMAALEEKIGDSGTFCSVCRVAGISLDMDKLASLVELKYNELIQLSYWAEKVGDDQMSAWMLDGETPPDVVSGSVPGGSETLKGQAPSPEMVSMSMTAEDPFESSALSSSENDTYREDGDREDEASLSQ